MGAHGTVLVEWLHSLHRSEALALWASLVSSVSISLPYVASTAADLEAHGLYWSATGSAYVLPSGYLMFAFRYVEVRFVAQWNPLWQALNLSITTQHEQILRLIGNITASLPASSNLHEQAAMVDVS